MRLLSHSLIKVLAVLFRLPGESFVSTGQGIAFRPSIIGVILSGRGVASQELASVSFGDDSIITGNYLVLVLGVLRSVESAWLLVLDCGGDCSFGGESSQASHPSGSPEID